MSETKYNNQIQQLVDLQKVDDEIHDEELHLTSAPAEVEELRRQFEALEHRRNIALDKQAHLEDQKKRLSLEIDDDAARIKKSKNKMMQVGNSREYSAMIREMDNMERSNRSREEERLTLLEAIEEHSESLGSIEEEYERLKKELEEKSASLDATVKEAQDKLAVLANKRKHYSADIEKPIFMRYEFIRNRLEHPVIVGVDNGICTGCHIAVPPQTFIELQTGQQILSCPNCQRLIYWSEEFAPAEAPKKTERKVARETSEGADTDMFFENQLKKGKGRQLSEDSIGLGDEDFMDQEEAFGFAIRDRISDIDADGDDSEI